MKTIAVCNTKGGVGKSTLLINIVVWLHDHGVRVAVVDADTQRTTVDTLENVAPEIPVEHVNKLEGIAATVKRLGRKNDVVFVDTPPHRGEAVEAVCVIADNLVIPIQPSKKDLLATGSVMKLVRVAQRRRRGKPDAAFVILGRKRDAAARELREALTTRGMVVARNIVRRLDALRDSDAVCRGKTADDRDAEADIENIIRELFTKTLKLKRRNRVANG